MTGCPTHVAPEESGFLRAEYAGFHWQYRARTSLSRRNTVAQARLILAVSSAAPRPLHIEAILPSPGNQTGERIRKSVQARESQVEFEGQMQVGWRANHIYAFRANVYEDSEYTDLMDSMEWSVLCVPPPMGFFDGPRQW